MKRFIVTLSSLLVTLIFICNIYSQSVSKILSLNFKDKSYVELNTEIIDSVSFECLDGDDIEKHKIKVYSDDIVQDYAISQLTSAEWSSNQIGEPIDLGLSVLWSNINLGAQFPADYGHYYPWADLRYGNVYSVNNYKWFNLIDSTIQKYNNIKENGFVDNIKYIELDDDPAYVSWGDDWRVPTTDEIKELIDNCNWNIYSDQENGYYGVIGFSKKNSNWIYLPAAGYKEDTLTHNLNTCGYYWSKNLYTDNTYNSYVMAFDNSRIIPYVSLRANGLTIRPVSPYPQNNLEVTSIELSRESFTMCIGAQARFFAKVKSGATTINAPVQWYIDDSAASELDKKDVASVTKNGVVTGRNLGYCILVARSGGHVAKSRIIVKATSLDCIPHEITMHVGQEKELKAELYSGPYQVYNQTFEWESSDEKIITVSEGVVTAHNCGESKIYVFFDDPSGEYLMDTCLVKVIPSRIELNEDEISLDEGEQYQLHFALYSGYKRVDFPVTWSSSNPDVANVDNNGLVTANTSNVKGECDITVSYNNLTAHCHVKVVKPFFYIEPKTISIYVDESIELNGYVNRWLVIDNVGGYKTESIDIDKIKIVSENPDVVTVLSDGCIKAVSQGVCVVSAYYTDESNNIEYESGCVVAVYDRYVDLGLSVKWATCNVGASSPEESGEYYSWGETKQKEYYYWETYELCVDGSNIQMTKYCFNKNYGYNGYTDDKLVLDPEDDVAHVRLGGSWRMPTLEEFKELRDSCIWEYTTYNGKNGYIITGKNKNHIFLPAAGFCNSNSYNTLYGEGTDVVYWTSTLDNLISNGDCNSAYCYSYIISSTSRYVGLPVRPVCP